jgi:hypothetical protein
LMYAEPNVDNDLGLVEDVLWASYIGTIAYNHTAMCRVESYTIAYNHTAMCFVFARAVTQESQLEIL